MTGANTASYSPDILLQLDHMGARSLRCKIGRLNGEGLLSVPYLSR